MNVTLSSAIDPRLLDRALLVAAALADEGDALAVESLVARRAVGWRDLPYLAAP